MKSHKKAFSMIELSLCIVVMMILAIFAIANIKPDDNKVRLFVYSSLSNISKVVGTIVTENSGLGSFDTVSTNDKLCLHVADFYALNTTAVCARSSGENVVNITFPNGVTIQGLASAWTTDTLKTGFEFKTILIDIDGNTKGMNKVGVDRFPVRIYRNDILDGTIVPVNCSLSNAGNYCKNGNTMTNVNLTTAANYISYDIYKQASANATKADMIMANKSFMEADCGVFGGLGYFTPAECAAKGYNVIYQCNTKEICEKCNSDGVNICALYKNTSTQLDASNCNKHVNEDNLACIMLLHKPPMGGGLILDTVLDNIAE